MRKGGSIALRFWALVNKTSDCWLWTASGNGQGYGKMRIGGRKGALVYAHRLSWELHYGFIPEGLHVLHRCDNGACVRPDHLFLGTHKDNMADAAIKERFPDRRGEAGGNVKLSAENVLAIRARKGQTQRALAAEFGVTHSQIGGISRGVYWPHLTAVWVTPAFEVC